MLTHRPVHLARHSRAASVPVRRTGRYPWVTATNITSGSVCAKRNFSHHCGLGYVAAASANASPERLVAPELARVDHAEMAAKIKSGLDKTIIVDVREDKELTAGRIKASLHIPSGVFKSGDTSTIDGVIRGQLNGMREIVFHCHGSMGRGPTCAKIVNDRMKILGIEGTEVKVLKGGVAAFMAAYSTDPDLAVVPEGGWVDHGH